MLLFEYDFKIEFYNVSGFDIIDDQKPQVVIQTDHGAPVVHIAISSEYSLVGLVKCKKARLQLFNMPLDFNKSLRIGDIVKIYYKKLAGYWWDDYTFIMSGYLGAPVDFDYESGDFVCQYEIYLLSKDTFFDKEIPIKDFQFLSVESAINKVFGSQAIIYMNEKDKKRQISESFYVSNFKEFIQRLLERYVNLIFVDVGDAPDRVDTKFIFINFNLRSLEESYKKLEDYGLLFIPQREVRIVDKVHVNFWNAILLFTDKIKIRDKVQFMNRYGETVRAVVQETNANLNNVGDCTLALRLYDEANFLMERE